MRQRRLVPESLAFGGSDEAAARASSSRASPRPAPPTGSRAPFQALDRAMTLAYHPTMKRCPDCNTRLSPIQIIDQLGHGNTDVGFHFTRATPPKTSAWSGKLKNSEGRVQAFLCEECGRVMFYACPPAT